MENIVTIVPEDKVVIINGIGYIIDMEYPAEIHAIQWANGVGHLEYKDARHNKDIAADDYAETIQPFVTAWQAAHAIATAPPPEPTLAEVAATKVRDIQVGKCRARDGGFTVDGILFDSDQAARTSYLELGAKLKADSTYTTRWKASTGIWVDMTATLFSRVEEVGAAHVQAVFAWQEAQEGKVNAILEKAEAETITEDEAKYEIGLVSAQYI